jgi:hypothetical protein
MKKFKNSLNIAGSSALLSALRNELITIGYKDITEEHGFKAPFKGLTTYTNNKCCLRGNYNSTYGDSNPIELTLPQDWDKAIQLASEVEEEVPEYVKVIAAYNGSSGWWIPGDIYKVNSWKLTEGKGLHATFTQINNRTNGWSEDSFNTYNTWKKYFIPATKKEFDAQELEFKKKELIEEAKRRGYKEGIKIILIRGKVGQTSCSTGGNFKYHNIQDELTLENNSSINTIYYQGEWATIVEDEFKVGDIVVVKDLIGFSEDGANYTASTLTLGGIYKVASKPWEYSKDEFGIKLEGYVLTFPIKSFRKATPKEIAKYNQSKENTIEIAGYKAEVKNGRIAFGCKPFSKEDLKAIKKVIELSQSLGLSFIIGDGEMDVEYDGSTGEVSLGVLNKLIERITNRSDF